MISALHDRGVLDETILDMIWEAQQVLAFNKQ